MGNRILVVDDDPDIREALLDTLRDEGHAAEAVPDGPAALRWLRREPRPCLVLLDWNMVPMNGGQVIEEINADPALRDVRVALLTADARIEKAETPGIVACLRKPVSLSALFDVLERHCG